MGKNMSDKKIFHLIKTICEEAEVAYKAGEGHNV